MALTQDKTGKVWKITGTTASPGEQVHEGPIWIKKIVWQEPGTAADDLTINEGFLASGSKPAYGGDTIVDYNVVAAGTGIDYTFVDFNNPYNGLVIDTMDSGTVWIHVE